MRRQAPSRLGNRASDVGEEVLHNVVWVVVDIVGGLVILVLGATGGIC